MVKSKTNTLTYHDVSSAYTYDPVKGILTRIDIRRPKGKIIRTRRWQTVQIKGQKISSAQVAWMLGFGEHIPPPNQIHFRDGDMGNLKLGNLTYIKQFHSRKKHDEKKEELVE